MLLVFDSVLDSVAVVVVVLVSVLDIDEFDVVVYQIDDVEVLGIHVEVVEVLEFQFDFVAVLDVLVPQAGSDEVLEVVESQLEVVVVVFGGTGGLSLPRTPRHRTDRPRMNDVETIYSCANDRWLTNVVDVDDCTIVIQSSSSSEAALLDYMSSPRRR